MAALLLLSCRSTVPQPTLSLKDASKPLPEYSMHNVGPQRTIESKSVKFVDLDMDGNLDLLIGGRGDVDGFHVELGDGAGHWRLLSGPPTSMQPRSFAVADVDQDDKLEVLIGGEGDQKGLQVWSLDEKKQWILHSSPIEAGTYHEVRLADLNRDGWPDIVAARSDSDVGGGIYVLLNNGRGGWLPGIGPMDEGYFTGISVADVNGDGNMDLIASRRGGLGAVAESRKEFWRQVGGVQVWYGDGDSRWEPEVLFADSDAESVSVADIDGNGSLDVVAGLYQGGIRLWRKRHNEWSVHNVVSEGTWSDVRVGDLDGDGHRELVASSSDGKGVMVWSWDGSLDAQPGLVPNYGVYYSLDLGDIRNSGQIDIAAIRADGGIEVWSGERAEPDVAEEITGKEVGETLSLFFDSGLAELNDDALNGVDAWIKSLSQSPDTLRFYIEGRADMRPIHSELYPNNLALSRARAESVAAWLAAHGVDRQSIQIQALGAEEPLPPGFEPEALSQNRRVFVKAYLARSVRLPKMASKQFKQDLFHVEENDAFRMVDGIPGYKIGAGDEISMTFWRGGKGEEHIVTVQVDGTVSLPYQEALLVADLTPREVDAKVTGILSRYERHPRVDVRVLKFRSKTVSIFGEVQNLTRQPTGPGNYHLIGRETLVDFLSRAGGPTKEADLTKVQVIRNGKTVMLNLERAIKQGDWAENAILDDGDTIFIPSYAQSKRQVYVLGEVGKPGIVDFNGDINFLDAVTKSGGFSKDAYLPDIRVVRADRDKPLILAVNFERFMEQGDLSQNLALQDKDVLIIPSRPVANWNKFIGDIQPTISLMLQPVTIATQILTLEALSRQVP